MKLVIDNNDVLRHVQQLPLPPLVKISSVGFEPGGAIVLRGSALFGFSVKLVAKIVGSQTIRIRPIEANYLGISLVDLLMAAASQMALPGVKVIVAANKDRYIEYTVPVDFLSLKEILTDAGVLTIHSDGVDILKLQSYLASAQKTRLETSGSMADQARLAQAAAQQ